jgi:hypothetical protein
MGIRATGRGAVVVLAATLLWSTQLLAAQRVWSASRCPSFGGGGWHDTALTGIDAGSLNELSGLQSSFTHPGLLWGVEDSVNGPHLYAFSSDGNIIRNFTLQGAHLSNWDWEALALDRRRGRDVIYIGDIGDNGHRRNGHDVRVPALYRIREPRVHASDPYLGRTLTHVKTFPFRYFTNAGVLSPRNAEALFVDPLRHDIIVITKDLETISGHPRRVRVFAMHAGGLRPGVRHLNHARQVATVTAAAADHSTGAVAADMSWDGRLIVVKSYGQGFLWRRKPDQRAWEPFRHHPVAPCRVPVDGAEAITFSYAPGGHWNGFWSVAETGSPPPPLRHLARTG